MIVTAKILSYTPPSIRVVTRINPLFSGCLPILLRLIKADREFFHKQNLKAKLEVSGYKWDENRLINEDS